MTRSYATVRRGRAKRMVLLGLVLLTLLDSVIGSPYKRSMQRLCSKNLSDALYLACKGRGYNEPFAYSSEDDPPTTEAAGLAEECCYHVCSYKQLEQYCKPNQTADAVRNSDWIVNSVDPSVRPGTSSEERSRSDIDYVAGTVKYKPHGVKGARKKGTHQDRDDAIGCDGRNSVRRHRGCRPRRQKHRRHGKASEAKLADRYPRAHGFH